MLPSIFRDNLFDDMFDFDDFDKEFNRMMRPLYGKHCLLYTSDAADE